MSLVFESLTLTLNQTGFLTPTQKVFSWFVGDQPIMKNLYEIHSPQVDASDLKNSHS
jgi:hypothetical protein